MQRHRWLAVVASLGTAIGLGACGSSSSSSNGEESKSVDQIFNDSLDALNGATQVHLTETSTDSAGTSKIDAVITGDAGRATVTEAAGTTTTIIIVGGKGYANQGGGFQDLPATLTTEVSSITLHNTVSCARKEHGGLTKGGVSTVNGRRVIAIADDGKAPGAAPSVVYVALDGPALPVRIVQSGPSTAGGSQTCGHSTTTTIKMQTVDIDYPPGTASITAPPVSTATGSGSTSTSTDTLGSPGSGSTSTSTDTLGSPGSGSTDTGTTSSSSAST